MVRLKKVTAFILVLVLSFSLSSIAFAEDSNESIMADLEAIADKYGVEVYEETASEDEAVLQFDTVDEFEAFIESFTANLNQEPEVVYLNPMSRSGYSTSDTVYVSVGGYSYPVTRYFSMNYSYSTSGSHRYFNSISSVSTSIASSSNFTWTQSSWNNFYSQTDINSDTANITVQGYFTLRVQISGVSAGTRISDTFRKRIVI